MAIDHSDSVQYKEAKGGDFAPTLTWVLPGETAEKGVATTVFEGVYLGSDSRTIKGEARLIHQFEDQAGEVFESFDTAILGSRLADVRKDVGLPALVKVTYLGKTAKTKAGRLIHDYSVLYAPMEG